MSHRPQPLRDRISVTEYVGPGDTEIPELLAQIGATDVVGILPGGEQDRRNWLASDAARGDGYIAAEVDASAWSKDALARLAEQFDAYGLRLSVLEDNPPLDRVRLAQPGRQEEVEWFCQCLESLGDAGVEVLCYSLMPRFDWIRTSVATPARGGAQVTAFAMSDLEGLPAVIEDAPEEEEMWESYADFLRQVAPVAESSGVRLALHPDDPPLSLVRGVPRIITSMDALERALSLSASPAHGLCFCQGNVRLMTSDVESAISKYAERSYYVHFRDVAGTASDFVETFHNGGPSDMPALLSAWVAAGYRGVMRPDHVPILTGDESDRPGYTTRGRLHALGYVQGLLDAIDRRTGATPSELVTESRQTG